MEYRCRRPRARIARTETSIVGNPIPIPTPKAIWLDFWASTSDPESMETDAVLEGGRAGEAVVDTVRKGTGMGREVVAEDVVDPVEEDVGWEDVVNPVEEDVGWEAGVALEAVISVVVTDIVAAVEPEPGLLPDPVSSTRIVDTLIIVAFTIGSRVKTPLPHASSNVLGPTLQL